MRTLDRTPVRLAALAVVLLALGACVQRDEGPRQPRLIAVQGEGSVVVAPDRATVMLSIAARNKDLKAAQREADQVVARVMEVAKGLGIEESKVQTTGIQIQPEFDWQTGKRVMLGYLVQRTTTIELEDLAKLGELMEKSLETGVNEVSPPTLFSSKRKELARQALSLAAEDARRNAEAIVGPLGAGVGELFGASGQGSGEPPRPMPMMAMRAMSAEKMDVAETYSAGEIRVTASVNAQFEIE